MKITNNTQEENRRLKLEKAHLLEQLTATNELAEFWKEKYTYLNNQTRGVQDILKGVLTLIEQEEV